MDTIGKNKSAELERTILLENSQRKMFAKNFLNNAGIVVGVFLMFAVIVIVTTDIHLISSTDLAALGLDFFLLLFVSYSMYVNCSDSGMRQALISEGYNRGVMEFEVAKRKIIDNNLQGRMGDFCHHYIVEELRRSRTSILAIVGISFEEYSENYVGRDECEIIADPKLSKAQKKAVIKANAIDPIKLTPEMIMKRGRGSGRRSPLGATPERKKGVNFGTKFATSFIISLAMSIIVLDAVKEPSWLVFATCCLKLLSVVINGFAGFTFGYENIAVDTVEYMADQQDLMEQAWEYFGKNDKV